MGCNCGKKRSVQAPPATASQRVASAKRASSVMMYDVMDADGGLVASYSNPVTARAEARRTGGTTVPRTNTSPAPAMVAASNETDNREGGHHG